MAKPQPAPKGIKEIDIRLGVCALASVLVYLLISKLIPSVSNYVNLCIMTICCVFIADEDCKITWKSGLTRLAVTGIGALAALLPIVAYDLCGSEIVMAIVFAVGVILALVVAKLLNLMYIQVRTGVVSYTLAAYTFHGANYAAMGKTGYLFVESWFVSTIVGIAVSVAVIFLFDLVKKLIKKN